MPARLQVQQWQLVNLLELYHACNHQLFRTPQTNQKCVHLLHVTVVLLYQLHSVWEHVLEISLRLCEC